MRGRSVSMLVTFYNDVPRDDIYTFFDNFGKSVTVTELQSTMAKRYTVEVSEDKARDYVEKFKASSDVLSVVLNEHEMNRPKPVFKTETVKAGGKNQKKTR